MNHWLQHECKLCKNIWKAWSSKQQKWKATPHKCTSYALKWYFFKWLLCFSGSQHFGKILVEITISYVYKLQLLTFIALDNAMWHTDHVVFCVPYPNDRVSTSRIEPVQSWVILQAVHTRSMLSFNFIAYNIRYLNNKQTGSKWLQSACNVRNSTIDKSQIIKTHEKMR